MIGAALHGLLAAGLVALIAAAIASVGLFFLPN
jgi:hypothetical protein